MFTIFEYITPVNDEKQEPNKFKEIQNIIILENILIFNVLIFRLLFRLCLKAIFNQLIKSHNLTFLVNKAISLYSKNYLHLIWLSIKGSKNSGTNHTVI
jgi:hypothetical protein